MAQDHPFSGKTAFISGASSGMGRAMAEEFARRGMQVVVAGNEAEECERVAAGLEGASAVYLDVRHEDSWVKALDLAEARHGPIAVMVSNAGVAGAALPVSELTSDAWEWTRSINLDGAFYGITHGLRRIAASGQPGHVVATTSMSIFQPPPRMAPYVATKAALIGVCEVLRAELVGSPIRVSVLVPGPVKTALITANTKRSPQSITVGDHGQSVVDWLANGKEPSAVANQVADALGTDQFWLFTHRDLEHRLDTRYAEMKAAIQSV